MEGNNEKGMKGNDQKWVPENLYYTHTVGKMGLARV